MFALCALAGCNTYKIPENHCIVGLYKDYKIYSESEREFCVPIDTAINGIEKEDNTNYFIFATFLIMGYYWECCITAL